MKARAVILVRDTSLWPVLHSCEVPLLYSKGYSSYRADTKLHLKWSRGNNSESMTTRVAILVCDTLLWLVLHNYKVSAKYSKRFLSYGADTKLHLKPSRGNNSESRTTRVVSLVHDTSWPVLHNCKVSWLYSKGYSSNRADTNMHKKHQRGDNSKSIKARALIFVRDTSSWPVLHNCEVSSKYSKQYSSYWADTKMFMDGHTGAS